MGGRMGDWRQIAAPGDATLAAAARAPCPALVWSDSCHGWIPTDIMSRALGSASGLVSEFVGGRAGREVGR